MAIGGPETPYALGQLPAEEIQQGQAAASMPAMSTPLGTGLDTAQTPLNPAAQQQANLKIGLEGPQLRGDRWYRNEEFYSGQERPAQYNASGGDPIWVASGGRVPMGILAERQSQLQAKKAELNNFIRSRYEHFKGKADPRYQQKYQQYARGEMDKYIQDYANANTGGNLNEAYKQIYSNPDARAAYEAKVADWEAIGAANKTAVPMAVDLLKGVYQNELQASPETMQLARQLATGMMDFNNDTPAAMRADTARNFERSLSKDKWWADFGSNAMKEAGDVLQQQGDVVYLGGRPFLRQRKQEVYDRFIQQAVQHGVANGIFGSPQEAMEFIQARTPSSDVTELSKPSLGSGGGADKQVTFLGEEIGPEQGVGSVAPIQERIEGGAPLTREEVESGMARNPVYRADFQLAKPIRLNTASGEAVDLDAGTIAINVDKSGKVFISGRNKAVTESIDANPEIAKKSAGIKDLDTQIGRPEVQRDETLLNTLKATRDRLIDEKAAMTRRIEKQKQNITIPLEGNEGSIPGLTPSVIQGIRQRGVAALGGQFGARSITPEQFNQQWAKLPKGGKLIGPDGVEYTKK